jgi:hypothetical protein
MAACSTHRADTDSGFTAAGATCRVCTIGETCHFGTFDGRRYDRCQRCGATLLDPAHFLTIADERAHYATHENHPDDPRYRSFLSRIAGPLLERLPPRQRGLDYGCGPGPALAAMLREAGHDVALYDPAFAPDPTALEGHYDFIACTETAEHFHRPADEFARLDGMLRPGGWLGVMTMFQTDDRRFADWHYRKDPTHVVFYREETMRVIAGDRGWRCEIPAANVVLYLKPDS